MYFIVDRSFSSFHCIIYPAGWEISSPFQRMFSKMLNGWPEVTKLVTHTARTWTSLPAFDLIAPPGGSEVPVPGVSSDWWGPSSLGCVGRACHCEPQWVSLGVESRPVLTQHRGRAPASRPPPGWLLLLPAMPWARLGHTPAPALPLAAP